MGNHSLFSIEEATLYRGRTTSSKNQSNMRIGLILLSALVVLAFVGEASARWFYGYPSESSCQAENQDSECINLGYGFGWIALYNVMRDDLEEAAQDRFSNTAYNTLTDCNDA